MDEGSTKRKQAHASMAFVQICFGGFAVITKVALNSGVNQLVFCTYRNIIAVIILAPVAYFYEKRDGPPITKRLLISFFVLGLTGIFGNQVLFITGLAYTNPTYAAAMQPGVPILTFLLSLLIGVEKLNMAKLEGLLKVGGIVVCVTGALLMVFLRGPAVLGFVELKRYPLQLNNFDTPATSAATVMKLELDRWHIGMLCLVAQSISFATYLALQAQILREYPANILLTTHSCLFGSIIFATTAVISTRTLLDWSLTWSEFLSVLYGGIIASGLNYGLSTWSNKILGPALVSLYSPFQPIASTLFSAIFLKSPIYVGSIAGGALIVSGLYMVTWASYKERRKVLVVTSDPNQIPELSEDLLKE